MALEAMGSVKPRKQSEKAQWELKLHVCNDDGEPQKALRGFDVLREGDEAQKYCLL